MRCRLLKRHKTDNYLSINKLCRAMKKVLLFVWIQLIAQSVLSQDKHNFQDI